MITLDDTNVETRAAILDRTDALDSEARVRQELSDMHMQSIPFPRIPPDLYGILSGVVAEDEGHAQFDDPGQKVELNSAVIAVWGERVLPDFSNVRFDILGPDALLSIWTYANSYCIYIRARLSYWEGRCKVLTAQSSYLSASLRLLYAQASGGSATAGQIRDCVTADPAMHDYTTRLTYAQTLVRYMRAYLDGLEQTVDMMSRFLTHHHAELAATMRQPGSGYRGGRR